MNQNEGTNNNGSNLVRANAIHPQPIRTVTESNESEIATQLDVELDPIQPNPLYHVVSFTDEAAANPPQNNNTNNGNTAANPGTAIVATVSIPLSGEHSQESQITNG